MFKAQRQKACDFLDDINGKHLPDSIKPKWYERAIGITVLIYVVLNRVEPQPGVARAEIFTMIIIGLVMSAASIVLSELLRPKPDLQDAKPAGNGDFKFPTAIEGRPIPVIWGTNKVDGPNVVWWGDFTQVPIKTTVKTGLWSKKKIISGWRYFVGIQMGLAHGMGLAGGGAIRRIWIGEKTVFTGTLSHEGIEEIDEPGLFGGDDQGTGGVVGTVRFHDGRFDQDRNPYLELQQDGSDTPGYGGTAHIVFEGGYIGNSTQIQRWGFEMERFPDNLSLTSNNHIVNTTDANPAEVLYESLTDTDWGSAIAPARIDIASFTAAGETLFTEGNGFSMVLDRNLSGSAFRRLVLEQTDGVIFQDRVTGLYTMKLFRDDYVVLDQQRLTDDNMIQIKSFSRQTWDNTTNQVRIGFTDRTRDYFDTFAASNDLANQRMQENEIISATIKYPGVKDPDLAVALAARELRFLSYPLAKATIEVNREFWDTNVGDVVLLNDTTMGITDLPMRVIRVDYGNFTSGKISLNVVQDIFSLETGFFGAPETPSWTSPVQGVAQIPLDDQLVIEAPKAVVDRDPDFPTRLNRIWCGAQAQAGENELEIRHRHDATTPAGDFNADGAVFGMTMVGELNVAINATDANPITTIELNANETSIPLLEFAFDDNVFSVGAMGQDLAGLLYIDGEFFSAGAVTLVTGSTSITLGPVYRSLLDSVPADHSVGAKVWLCFSYMGLNDELIPEENAVEVKLITKSRDAELAEGTALTVSLTMDKRYDRPYPPHDVTLNTVRLDATLVDLDNVITNASGDDQGIDYEFQRKDFRTADEVASVLADAEAIDATFPAANTTQNSVRVYGIDGNAVESASPIFDNGWAAGTTGIADRASILAFYNGDVSGTIRSKVETRHTVDGDVLESLVPLIVDSTMASATVGSLENLGRIPANSPQGPYEIQDGAQDHVFTISSAIGQDVQYQLNSTTGAWTSVITAGGTTGTILAAALTTTDLLYVRHLDGAGTPDYTFLLIEEGTTDVAYGIIDTTAAFDSLRGWWPMDETSDGTAPVSRVARFGTRTPDFDDTNGNCASVDGPTTSYGNAVRCFDNAGTAEWLEIASANMDDLLPGATDDFTFTLWVKLAEGTAQDRSAQAILTKYDFDSGTPAAFVDLVFGFYHSSPSNGFIWAIGSNSARTFVNHNLGGTAQTNNDGVWIHFGLIYESGTNVEIVVNGVSQDTNTPTGNLHTNTEPFAVGAGFRAGVQADNVSPTDVEVDDLRMYHRALSVAEILAIYELGAPL